jgi:predicted acetyltransferase
MDVEVRPLRPGEELAFVQSERVPFLDPATDDEEARHADERAMAHLETDRAWVAVDRGRMVGNANIFSLDLTLPAFPGQLAPVRPLAGVSGVGVHPTHRRRGLLRRLMAVMLEDARTRGEPLAGLLASESVIYGRFGFGHATTSVEVTVDSLRSGFLGAPPELDLRLVDRDEAAKILPEMFDRLRRARAGEPNRDAAVWEDYLGDRPSGRRGANGKFVVVCEEGYATYRAYDADIMRAEYPTVVVEELRGETAEVEAALWRFVFDLDLVGEVRAKRRPVDEPLRWRLADPRQLKVDVVRDRLYLRILDVPAALESRGYRRSGRLVLDVRPLQNEPDSQPDPVTGRWVLEAGPDGASCRPARNGEDADLRLGVTELSALYLGGVASSTLAAAGRLDELQVGSLDRADALLATTPAPLTGTGF